MTLAPMSARAFMTMLLHGAKIADVVRTAFHLGILARLDEGPIDLRALAAPIRARPLRLYKFLDVLESAGLVRREEPTEKIEDARYVSVTPLHAAAESVFGDASIERDRERWSCAAIQGHLEETLRGDRSIPHDDFAWPPRGDQVAAFEASMAAGVAPIVETFTRHAKVILGEKNGGSVRMLDVGGGDGALAVPLLRAREDLRVDVFNLPEVEPLVRRRQAGERLGFVGGDFLRAPLPRGYDVLAFVRVFHDWPPDVAASLLGKAFDALPRGGRVIVCEEFRSPDRLAVQLFWTYFLIGVDACVSRLREIEWYESRLFSSGFVDVRPLTGAAFDLVVATRP